MKSIETKLCDVKLFEPLSFSDNRGTLVKTYQKKFFDELGIVTDINECLFSVSKKHVIRGMHFQLPPKAQGKIIYVSKGSIIDVIIDLRKKSPTFMKHESYEINDLNRRILYVPHGFAHGFMSKEDDTIVSYLIDSPLSKEHEAGIKYDSFGFDWQVERPIVSERDANFIGINDFVSPF